MTPNAAVRLYCGRATGRFARLQVAPRTLGANMASVDDLRLVLLSISAYMTAPSRGGHISITTGDLLLHLGQLHHGGSQAQWLRASISRLTNTFITTDFGGPTSTFPLLETVTGETGMMSVELPRALRELVDAEGAFVLPPDTLQMRGLRRRLAGWAHAGAAQRSFTRLPLNHAYARSGSRDAPRKFLSALRRTLPTLNLPGVQLHIRPGRVECLEIQQIS